MQRSFVVVVLAAVLVACTAGTSDPGPDQATTTPPLATPTERVDPVGRVAVVVDPRLGQRATAVRDGLTRLHPDVAGGRTIRVEVAEDPAFVPDLARFFAAEGHELVCVLGPDAGSVVRDVAPRAPGTRFCAAPVVAEAGALPDNVLPVDVRVEELGYLAGVALGTDLDRGPVAALTDPSGAVRPPRLRAGLRAGLLSVGLRPDVMMARLPADAAQVAPRVRSLLGDGIRGLVGLAATDAVREVATRTDVAAPAPTRSPIAGSSPPPRPVALVLAGPVPGDLPPHVLAVIDVHLHEAVLVALRRHLEDWDPTPVTLGVADDAIVAVPNTRARSPGVAAALADAEAALRAGEVRPGTSTPTPAASTPVAPSPQNGGAVLP